MSHKNAHMNGSGHQAIVRMLGFTLALAIGLMAGMSAWAFEEAPDLATKVASGSLPSVEDRLPKNPLVVKPLDGVGTYGGTWRFGDARGADEGYLNFVAYEGLTTLTPGGVVVPNLVEKIETSEDKRAFTLHLREGLRWSDGELLTSKDFMFWYENVLSDARITPTPPDWIAPGGKIGVFSADGDYTVKITFEEPHTLFLLQAARWLSVDVPVPAQYLADFHVDTADSDELAKRIADAGLSTWTELWELKQNPLLNTERPVLRPWILVKPFGEGIDSVAYERNPFYWKTDPEGKQLPYIDRVEIQLVQDVEVLNLMALDGAFDWQYKDVARLDKLALFRENTQRGDYRLTEVKSRASSFAAFYLNLSHKDPVLRELFREADFRKALSYAIDRQTIVDLVHFGITSPSQPSPLPGTAFYSSKLSGAALEYDPEKANQLLDTLGLAERNSDGIRLRADGKPLRLLIQAPAGRQNRIDAGEMTSKYWRKIGIEANFTVNSRELHQERRLARDFDVWMWSALGGTFTDILLDPGIYLPFNMQAASTWGLDFAEWRLTNGAKGTEPTGDIRRAMDMFDDVLVSSDTERQSALIKQIIDIASDNLWVFGIGPRPPEFAVVKISVRNVPESFADSPEVPGMLRPETWYYAK